MLASSPDGSLKKYDPYTTETTVESTGLPSDPKDPNRKNDVKPTDIPQAKEDSEKTKIQRKEEHKNSYISWQ